MRTLLLVILLSAAPCILSQELPRVPLPDVFYQHIIQPLLPEIEIITRLPLPSTLPVVYLARRADIQAVYCNADSRECSVAAVTDARTGDITLSQELLMSNLVTISVVFHELVHWAQIKNHLFDDEADCAHWAKSEMHAYTAQSRWLALHGAHGFAVPDLLTTCR